MKDKLIQMYDMTDYWIQERNLMISLILIWYDDLKENIEWASN